MATHIIIDLLTGYMDAPTFGKLLLSDKETRDRILPCSETVALREIQHLLGPFYEACKDRGIWDAMLSAHFLNGNRGFLEEYRHNKVEAMSIMIVYLIERIREYQDERQFRALYQWAVCSEHAESWENIMDAFHYAAVMSCSPRTSYQLKHYMMVFYDWCLDFTMAHPLHACPEFMRTDMSLQILKARCQVYAQQFRCFTTEDDDHRAVTFLETLTKKIKRWQQTIAVWEMECACNTTLNEKEHKGLAPLVY